MKINIKGLHLDVTEALKDKINKESESLKEILADTARYSLKVDLSIERYKKICHLKLVGDRVVINVEKENDDMYDCITDAFKTIKSKYIKEKNKKIKDKRKHNIKSVIREESDIDDLEEYPNDFEE